MTIAQSNVTYIQQVFRARLGDSYVYGGVWSPTDPTQGCDCSGLVGTVLEALTNGPQNMSWDHVVSTESWPYDYDTNTPAAPGTVGPYGTIAVASPDDIPASAALTIDIMHGGGGENSHMNCVLLGEIMESNGDNGTCTNGTGGALPTNPEWTSLPQETLGLRRVRFSLTLRYSCRHSHFRPLQPSSRSTFTADGTLPYHPPTASRRQIRSFGAKLEPR